MTPADQAAPSPDRRAAADGQRVAALLVSVMRLAGRTSSRAKTGPLSNARYELLHSLVHHGSEPMGQVARRLGVTPRTVTDMVDALETDGLVRRVLDPGDRRLQLLEITHSGLEVAKAGRQARLAEIARLLDPLSAAEHGTLAELLEKITSGPAPQR
ncbi:MAG: MarR family winged helix-turn-helix transcriptional regulator [Acidimicrobiia bacterium]